MHRECENPFLLSLQRRGYFLCIFHTNQSVVNLPWGPVSSNNTSICTSKRFSLMTVKDNKFKLITLPRCQKSNKSTLCQTYFQTFNTYLLKMYKTVNYLLPGILSTEIVMKSFLLSTRYNEYFAVFDGSKDNQP